MRTLNRRRGEGEGCFAAVLVIVLVGVILVASMGGGNAGYERGVKAERQAAVEAGVAEWYATAEGKVEFRYKGK